MKKKGKKQHGNRSLIEMEIQALAQCTMPKVQISLPSQQNQQFQKRSSILHFFQNMKSSNQVVALRLIGFQVTATL